MNNRHTLYREILKISLPVSLALLIPFFNLSINNFFLGKLGELELGTAGITGVYYLLLAMLGNGLHSAVQTIIARRTGEDNREAIGRTFGQGIIISLSFSLVLILITYLLLPSFFKWVLRHDEVKEIALDFMNIRIIGLPFLFLFQLANAFFMGTTNTRFLVYGTVVQAGLNILLDYGLIFGNMGLPVMGFKGAAVASVFSEIAGMCVIYVVLLQKKFHIQFRLFSFFKFQRSIFRQITQTSMPLMGQYAISLFSWLLFYLLIEHLGERSLAISNLMRNLFSFTGIFIWAFASTTNTMVSMYIGQKKEEKVIYLISRITELSLLIAALLFIIINLQPGYFLELFGLSPSFVEEGIPVLRMVSLAIIFQSISVIWLNGVTGTGKTVINLIIEIVAIIFYGIYVYLVIEVYQLNLVWAWASELVYWIIILTLSVYFLYKGKWKTGSAYVLKPD